jgi:hypothetical protein
MHARQRFICWHPRFELCGVCRKPTRGFGWSEPQRVKRPRPATWFCSITCQDFFFQQAKGATAMVDLTNEEHAAIRHAMEMVAELMEEIGWETRLADLSEQQVLTIIETALGGFQDAMRTIATKSQQKLPEIPF